jgi:hypothetical protein
VVQRRSMHQAQPSHEEEKGDRWKYGDSNHSDGVRE